MFQLKQINQAQHSQMRAHRVQVPAEVRWAAGPDVQALWLAAGRLLLDRHAWVRRAAGRLLGAAFADAKIGVSSGPLRGYRVQGAQRQSTQLGASSTAFADATIDSGVGSRVRDTIRIGSVWQSEPPSMGPEASIEPDCAVRAFIIACWLKQGARNNIVPKPTI